MSICYQQPERKTKLNVQFGYAVLFISFVLILSCASDQSNTQIEPNINRIESPPPETPDLMEMRAKYEAHRTELARSLLKQIQMLGEAELAGNRKAVSGFTIQDYYFQTLSGRIIRKPEFLKRVGRDQTLASVEFGEPFVASEYDGDYELEYTQTRSQKNGEQTRTRMAAYFRDSHGLVIIWQKEIEKLN